MGGCLLRGLPAAGVARREETGPAQLRATGPLCFMQLLCPVAIYSLPSRPSLRIASACLQ
jgi:hypothetical protein